MSQPLTLAVIGDSAASGVGDSDANGNHFGWGYHLAQAFNEPLIYINAARPGARSREVLEEQLVKVSVHDPDLVAVVVGGNDLLRSNFSPTVFEQNLRETLIHLVSTGATIMLLELHDPTKIVPMPYLVGRICRRRVVAVNKATKKMAEDFGAIMLPTRSLENIYARSKWHVDRMHPSKLGHQFIASEFAKRSIDLFPGLIWLSLAEIVHMVSASPVLGSKGSSRLKSAPCSHSSHQVRVHNLLGCYLLGLQNQKRLNY